jgi:transcriptional regulator with XRE-family HTH domain
MMTIGEKLRGIRDLKKLSQENMAAMLGLSVLAYGEIERGNDIKLSRLNQIAEKLGTSTAKILGFEESISNFFDQCSGAIGLNNGQQNINYDQRETQHHLEKAQLELKNSHLENDNLRLKLEKVELELKYWKEKGE